MEGLGVRTKEQDESLFNFRRLEKLAAAAIFGDVRLVAVLARGL
jgi:hypothetical protein